MCLEPRHTDRLPTAFLSRRPFGFPGNAEPPREGSAVVSRRATDAASTRAAGSLPGSPNPLFDLVGQYYSGERVVLRPDVAPQARDAAIFAMWSQQWPGLRSSFSFRTAQGDDSRRSELIDYNVQVRGGGANSTSGAISESTWPTWVVAAAEDALTTCVTTLRRFLWRYGRDLVIPRAHFRTLVELYLALQDSEGRWADVAVRIFESLPEAGDGEILKGDILGIGSASPSLIPALPPAGLLQLLASKRLHPDFRFRCGTVTHRISSRALIARVPTQEPRDGG